MDNKSKYQKFEIQTISRQDIKNADYNPRIMDKNAKKRLKTALRKHGLVSALTWNKRTGNLVGGHQRLEQLDSLEENDNYSLTLCVIDVDERDEAELNVQLNNPSMQGEWDLDKLAMMSEEFDLSFDDMGFTEHDIDFMFEGDDRFSALFETKDVTLAKETINDIKNTKKEYREAYKDRDSAMFYTVVVFENPEDRRQFHKEISIPEAEKYVTAEQVRRIKNRTIT